MCRKYNYNKIIKHTNKGDIMSNLWKFSHIPCIEESTFNKVLERFYNFGIAGLVRENIQNSLDGKLPGGDKPVVVNIKTGTIQKQFIPGIDEIKDRINCLEGRNSYTKETIQHMKNKMKTEEINYISFEDSNTKGLKGAINGQSDNASDTWSIYAYNKGVHTEEDDETIEKSRGGSHGIGKIASNSASELYMMYFANCDEEGNQHLGGTVQLIEHKYENKYYRSTGYFTDEKSLDEDKTKFYPYENNFNEIFKKDTRGLKIIIPYLRDQFNDEREILRSVCDSFFIAIRQGRLEVIINDKKIDSNSIDKYIKDPNYYTQEFSDIKDVFTLLYFDTYENVKEKTITIQDKDKVDYNFKLYFRYDDTIPSGRVGIIRTIGMKIEDKKIKNNVRKPFNAVMIPVSTMEDAFLKSLENESHTELSYEHIKDQKIQNNARKFINNLVKVITKEIEDAVKQNNPTDGAMNTSDLLYIVENQFKKDLSKSTPTIKLNKGDKEKTVVKVNPEVKKKNDPKEKKPKKEKSPTDNPRVRKVKNPGDTEKELESYSVHPEIVERLIVGESEYIKFDFSQSSDIKKAKKCNISLAVVDGMRKEYANEFSMKDNYSTAIDMLTKKNLSVASNSIKDVKIDKGIVQIQLKLNKSYNRALKFVYYVEV